MGSSPDPARWLMAIQAVNDFDSPPSRLPTTATGLVTPKLMPSGEARLAAVIDVSQLTSRHESTERI